MLRATRHKYHAKPVLRDGIRFASTAEADWYDVLQLQLRSGMITGFRRQVRYPLGDITYVADFEVLDAGGRSWAEEVKGVETPRFRLVRRLWPKYGPHPLRIIKRRGREWIIEQIEGVNERSAVSSQPDRRS